MLPRLMSIAAVVKKQQFDRVSDNLVSLNIDHTALVNIANTTLSTRSTIASKDLNVALTSPPWRPLPLFPIGFPSTTSAITY